MDSSSAMNNNTASRPRKRAAAACQACHARKIRCSLSVTGVPCTNCSLDGVVCDQRMDKRRKTEDRTEEFEAQTQSIQVASPRINIQSQLSTSTLDNRGSQRAFSSISETQPRQARHDSSSASMSVTGEDDAPQVPYRPLAEHFSHHGPTTDLFDTTENAPINHFSPIYGDPAGVGLVADICEPDRRDKSGHFLVPRIRQRHLDPETTNFLRWKGVFDLPKSQVCDELLRVFFYYVHPFFPVVEPKFFIEEYESPRRSELSIHLLWSIFLAASNFTDDALLKEANFASRKEMKRSMDSRAKALYDAEYEKSKVVLIQAVLLMGFWFDDTEDRTGPWHWNGVAIGLCQTIGLHRDPDGSASHWRTASRYDKRLWRQLWWSCFYREAWFSVDANETEELLAGMEVVLRKKYLPENITKLAELWVQLLDVTVVLSKVLSEQHRVKRRLPDLAEIECKERQLRTDHEQHRDIIPNQSPILLLHTYHLELYIESVFLILYRPFLLVNLDEQPAAEWKLLIERKTRRAGATTNRILSNLISEDMISICQSMICIALVPTLQIHLLDYTSHKDMVQRMGCQHLDLCMLVIEELRKTYFGAEILFRMFTKAQRQIRDRREASRANLQENRSASLTTTVIDRSSNIQDMVPNSEMEMDGWLAIWNSFSPVIPDAFFNEAEIIDLEQG